MPPFPSPTQTYHSKIYAAISPTRPALSAKGKTIVITGGGTGIGAETALYFAEAGASRIALLGRREQPLIDTKARIEAAFPNTEVFAASTDISNKHQVDTNIDKFINSSGKIDVLVANAAVIGPQAPIKTSPAPAFLSSINQNLSGALYIGQAFLRHAAPDAVIIDINSSAMHINFPNFAPYTIAKFAVFKFWDLVMAENPDLSVYHVQPGVVDTAMNREAGGVELIGYEDHVSLPAGFNVWLASPEARFLKGRFLWANWDVEELRAQEEEIESGKLSFGLVGWPFGSGA